MRSVNLLSLNQAYRNLDKIQFTNLIHYYGIDVNKKVRDYEFECIESLRV